jgi:multicomponent Na+:H+ antiporter subunit D
MSVIIDPIITLLPPLLVIPFIIFFGERHKNLREASILIAASLLFITNVFLYQQFLAGQILQSQSLVLFNGLELFLKAEPIGIVFGLLASFLWIVTTIYSIGYMRGHKEQNQTRFYTCFAIAIACVMAAAYSGNLLTLFVAYEAITLSTFPLVTHAGNAKAKRAGRIYIGVLMGGSIFLLMPAIIVTWWMTGTTDFTIGGVFNDVAISPFWVTVLLCLMVFGTGKAALMPFHGWLPNAMVAPTPVSALLHAVAVVKTGVFLIIKIVVYIFGIDLITKTNASELLLFVAAGTILLSSFIAMKKDNIKARLAYSTISQLAYIVLAALIANARAIEGAVLHIVSHAFGKITLFFCAGAIMVAAHKTLVSELAGLGRKMPYTFAAFFIAAISIIGLPPLVGVLSKFVIVEGIIDSEYYWLIGVLILSSLLNIAYLLPIPFAAFFKENDSASHNADDVIEEAPVACLIAIAITTTACIVLFFQIDPIMHLLSLIKFL